VEAPDLALLHGRGDPYPIITNPGVASRRLAPAEVFGVVGTLLSTSFDSGVDPKIVADRIGHANMAYTLAIYTHKSTGKDRGAAETVATVLLGAGWTCTGCSAVHIGTLPHDGLCETCRGDV